MHINNLLVNNLHTLSKRGFRINVATCKDSCQFLDLLAKHYVIVKSLSRKYLFVLLLSDIRTLLLLLAASIFNMKLSNNLLYD